MNRNRTNSNKTPNLNFFVPGFPVYDGMAEALAPRIVDLVTRVINLFTRFRR